ncbi:SusC/RagA family TonB-linked outer membrane protein [Pedobacter planticolens]|nr:SusC/RagA family TonB-linked outer membrane protein [Pedobacter planticolens]
MKLTVIIMIVSLMQVSAATFGQNVTLKESRMPLEKVFKEIRKQTGYDIFLSAKQVKLSTVVNVDFANVPLKQVIDKVLAGLPFTYSIEQKTIVIKEVEKNLIDKIVDYFAAIDVRGRVLDENGKPLAGASVMVKGTGVTVSSNENGEFLLTDVDTKAVIVISFVGYKVRDIKASNDLGTILMEVLTSDLSEVEVVNTGYQTLSKERSVGSFTKIDSTLINRSVSTNFINRLDGITNGLVFDKKSSGGGRQRLQIRGVSTIKSDNSPLIILDNFPFSGEISNINPNDIQDITVLKDAAAASIWGTRAGNGVIVITTKSGRYDQPLQVSANSSINIEEKPNLSYFPQISNSEFIDLEKDLFSKGYYNGQLDYPAFYIQSPVVLLLAKQRNGQITGAEAENQINLLKNNDLKNDFDKYVYRSAINFQNYLNLKGGGPSMNYSLSLGLDNNRSNTNDNGGFERYTINPKVSFSPFKFLELNTNISFARTKSRSNGIFYPISPGSYASRTGLYPYARLADDIGNPLSIPYQYGSNYVDTAGNARLLDWTYKPLDEMRLSNNSTVSNFYQINVGAKLKLAKGLIGSFNYQYTDQLASIKSLRSKESFYTRDLINTFTQINIDGTLTRIVPLGDIVDLSEDNTISQNTRGQISYTKNFSDKHTITGFVAGETSKFGNKFNNHRLFGYNDDILSYSSDMDFKNYYPTQLGGSAIIASNVQLSEGAKKNLVSLLANVSYTYDNRYSFYGSARKDGSNIFGVKTNNKWKPLWSLGAGWDVSNEKFYQSKILTYLRLRTSYGYSGNANNSISALPTIRYNSDNSIYTANPEAYIEFPSNPNLRWEEVRTFNTGIDFSVSQGRIDGSIDYFTKRSKDLISPALVDQTTGFTQVDINYANLSVNGIDLNLNSKNLTGVFKWSTMFNFSYSKSIVTKYYSSNVSSRQFVGSTTISPLEGNMAYAIYSYKWAGLDPLNGDPQGYLKGQISKNYNALMSDSIQNQKYHGSAIPLYFGNILNTFKWKNFSVSANITYKFDYYFRAPSLGYSGLFANWNLAGSDQFSKRWIKTGDENSTNVPSMRYPANPSRDIFYQNSEVNVERGDNIRLKDIKLAYNFGGFGKNKSTIRGMTVFVLAENLNYMIWKKTKSNFDPDYLTTVFPQSKSFSCGINISL